MKKKADTATAHDPYKKWIVALSVIIPLAIAGLFTVKIEGYDFSFLPPIYATINAITAVLLLIALFAILRKNIALHKKLMMTCLGLSALFLMLYVVYHITSDSTRYGGDGWVKTVYLLILASHILLSIAVVPLVLITYSKTLTAQFDKHRKIARFTWPIWFYVAISGVIVYVMISPYY